MKLSEKAAYLKGLAEGMNIAEATPNDKLITKLLDLVAEMAGTIELLEDRCDELTDYADELDADLGDVEEYLFSDDDEDDYCDCDCDDDYCECEDCEEYDTCECDGDCANCGEFETRELVASDHSLGQWYIYREAVCGVNGEVRRDCSKCDYYESRELTAPEHQMGAWEVVKQAACGAEGLLRR